MPIEELRDDQHLVQRCARCSGLRELPLADLTAGVNNPLTGIPSPSLIQLPPCPTCRAQEFLIAAADGVESATEGEPSSRHRLLVNELHARLVNAGRLAEGLDTEGSAS